ncbi:hypothetical protein P3T76_013540 [Phytophthora citrophthora]|uniref:Sensor domain-containing protein n=1 Tax=Phytophthora citrophthora TaxID=4793 RepID=A0AAD9LC18_9STRA|nr:hypothetical protein P3T76_013540 [Phytophthora citrophthora]
MKSPAGEVIYHRYPDGGFDPAEKPVPVALSLDATEIDDEEDEKDCTVHSPLASSPPGRCSTFCARLVRLLMFHIVNAFLGLGGAILVLVLVPLSVGLIPLLGVGIVLFQLSAGVVEVLARIDICLANMVSRREPRLQKAFGIQGGLSTNNGYSNWCQFSLSPKMLLVMLYFATIKLVVGFLSIIAVAYGVIHPIEALISVGDADAIGWVKYPDHPTAFVFTVLVIWAVGMLLVAFVPKLSVALTVWACSASEEDMADIRTPRTDGETRLQAVVIETPTYETKTLA